MDNPFDADPGKYLVLVNDEGQHSLWPEFLAVPQGWQIRLPANSRKECIAWIEANWRDIRPKSLTAELSRVQKP